jgi:hypothetical protein
MYVNDTMKCAQLKNSLFLMVVLLLGLVLIGKAISAGSDLLGWWPLDEGVGDVAYDVSGKANHGTIHNPRGGLGPGGSVWDTDPERGVVLSFNGDDTAGAYVDAGNIIPAMTLANNFTWAFWAKQAGNGTGVNEVILGNRHGASDSLQFSKFTPTKFEYYNNGNNSGFIDYEDLPAGVWFHHVVVKDGATLTYYRNGVVSGRSTTTATLVAQPFHMGGDASAERWSGRLSDVRIYNHAASEAEIAEIMSGYASNMRPFVDAGDDRTVILPNEMLVLNGTVTDDGVGDPNGFLAMEWSQLSGPGAVSFEPNEFVEDPTVKFPPVLGTYRLQLYATDGEKDATDTVMIAVDEPFCPVGDLNGDCRVDWQDLQIFAGRWLDDSDRSANINGDAVVNAMDFSCLAQNWLKARAFLVINEFMASNSTYLEDPQGQYDDWLEIYNAADVAIDVGGMYLTDDLDEPTKWQIPSDNPSATTIPAHGYLLIWADSDTGDAGLHANFQLDVTGEKIGLFDVNGSTLIDSISFSEQKPDISYGRYPDGSNNWRFLGNPTAGYQNDGAYLGLVADTKFSRDRGFYDAPFEVVITCATPDAIIHYTTDGSAPTETHGHDYASPIRVDTTTCLRAIAFKPGWMSTNVDTHTYIFLEDVINQPSNPSGFPTTWGGTAADYQMDPDIVYDARYNDNIKNALTSIPTMSIAMNKDHMFGAEGIHSNAHVEREKPASAELLYPDGTQEGFQVNCGIKIIGGASRSMSKKHSFRLLFKGIYGPSKLRFPLFGPDAASEFNTIVLRSSFNDGYGWSGARYYEQYTRDEFIRTLQRDMGHASPNSILVHLYINGLYWGLYFPCERPDASFSASYYGGEEEDWDTFSHSGITLREGNDSALDQMTALCQHASHSDAAYQQLQGNNPDGSRNPDYPYLLDITNYIDYLILNYSVNNEDWPWNNYWFARKRTADSTGFKFYSWDSEISLYLPPRAHMELNRTTDFRNIGQFHGYLIENDEYRLSFADRVHHHLFNNGILTPEYMRSLYLDIANQVEMPVICESARWGDMHHEPPLNQDDWYDMRDWLLENFFHQRYDIVLQQLKKAGLYPEVEAPTFYVNDAYQHSGYISPTDLFSISAAAGTIYYTLDGTDPRLPATSEVTGVTLVHENAAKRVLVPTGAISGNWKSGVAFDDSAWDDGTFISGKTGGVGYDENADYKPYITYDIEAKMNGDLNPNANTSCYIRIPFTVNADDLPTFNFMTLRIRYDDGFVAYINGVEVTRYNFTGTPAWNSKASSQHPDSAAVAFENVDISNHLSVLQVGGNILAIHGLNISTTSSDLLISAELVAGKRNLVGDYLSPSAIKYAGPIILPKSTHVKARVLDGTTWSALNEATFAVGPVAENLRITEVLYHPQDTDNPNDPNEEFVELTNIGTETLNLNLVRFTNGIDFTFPSLELAAGDYVVVVADLNAFQAEYGGGVNIAGVYSGRLANNGERVRLQDAIGQTILDFKYEDGWYDITDGLGFSLTIRDPYSNDPNNGDSKSGWRPSAFAGGSPGWDDTGAIPELGDVVINELLAHSHAGTPDWIELHNTTSAAINIGGWFLSDSADNLKKYEIVQGKSIPADGYIVFYEDQHFGNTNDPGCHEPFAWSENGETLYLHSGQNGQLTGYNDEEKFGASDTGVAFGRYQKSTGTYNFVAMSENTPGLRNAYPKVGPIVITEIMYHPDIERDAEYVELLNISSAPVVLYDSNTNEPWKFNDEGGIEFFFPDTPVTIEPGEYILLVKDLAIFNLRFTAPSGTQIFEWGSGNLSNGGEKVDISKPGDVDEFAARYYIRVDRVNYSDGSHHENFANLNPPLDPWSIEPDGGGMSLTRKVPTEYGNDVINWKSALPSPGSANP